MEPVIVSYSQSLTDLRMQEKPSHLVRVRVTKIPKRIVNQRNLVVPNHEGLRLKKYPSGFDPTG